MKSLFSSSLPYLIILKISGFAEMLVLHPSTKLIGFFRAPPAVETENSTEYIPLSLWGGHREMALQICLCNGGIT